MLNWWYKEWPLGCKGLCQRKIWGSRCCLFRYEWTCCATTERQRSGDSVSFHLDVGRNLKVETFHRPHSFLYKLRIGATGFLLDSWTLIMGPTDCPETSVRNYHYPLHNNPEERSSQLLHGESLKLLKSRGGKQIAPNRRWPPSRLHSDSFQKTT